MLYVGTKGSENLFVFFGDDPWFFCDDEENGKL